MSTYSLQLVLVHQHMVGVGDAGFKDAPLLHRLVVVLLNARVTQWVEACNRTLGLDWPKLGAL